MYGRMGFAQQMGLTPLPLCFASESSPVARGLTHLLGKAGRMTLIACVAGLLLPSSLLAVEQSQLNDRINHVRAMSKIDRERLNRNIEEFQGLSEDKKKHFREMHEELTKDQKEGSSLSSILKNYVQWVQTLSPAQRDELRQETDVAKRIVIVRRFKEEQDRPAESSEPHTEESQAQPAMVMAPFPPRYAKAVMDAKELSATMKILVDALPEKSKKSDFEPLQLDQYLAIIEASIQTDAKVKEWPNDYLYSKIYATLSKDKQKMINNAPSKRDAIIKMMLVGIVKQARDGIRFPTEEERNAVALSLPQDQRDQILKNSKERLTQQLTRKWFESRNDDSWKIPQQYRRSVLQMFNKLEVDPPPEFAPRISPKKPSKGKG